MQNTSIICIITSELTRSNPIKTALFQRQLFPFCHMFQLFYFRLNQQLFLLLESQANTLNSYRRRSQQSWARRRIHTQNTWFSQIGFQDTLHVIRELLITNINLIGIGQQVLIIALWCNGQGTPPTEIAEITHWPPVCHIDQVVKAETWSCPPLPCT